MMEIQCSHTFCEVKDKVKTMDIINGGALKEQAGATAPPNFSNFFFIFLKLNVFNFFKLCIF